MNGLVAQSGQSVSLISGRSRVQIPLRLFFSKSKILNLPIKNTHNVSIKCKSIRVKNIDIYVKNNEGKFILDEIYREKLSGLLENNNSKENV